MSNADPQEGIDETIKQIHVLCEQMVQMNELVKEVLTKMPQGQHVTMTHKSEGMGAWGVAAVTACFVTYLSLILFAGWAYFQINNLWAWKDIHASKIAVIEGRQRPVEK